MLIGYARVSTSKQGQSLDTQRDALIDAGCDPQHIYSDTISGTKWQRPGLDDALAYIAPTTRSLSHAWTGSAAASRTA